MQQILKADTILFRSAERDGMSDTFFNKMRGLIDGVAECGSVYCFCGNNSGKHIAGAGKGSTDFVSAADSGLSAFGLIPEICNKITLRNPGDYDFLCSGVRKLSAEL